MLFGPLAGSATYMWSQYEKKNLKWCVKKCILNIDADFLKCVFLALQFYMGTHPVISEISQHTEP